MSKNTGKKYSVIKDELKIDGGGCYAMMPFLRLDDKNKAIFKVGQSINFVSSFEMYHTDFPLGVFLVAFLINPPVRVKTRSSTEVTKRQLYLKIEKFIINHIVAHGAKRIKSTTRITGADLFGGQTERFYTTPDIITNAFYAAHIEYQGDQKLIDLKTRVK